MCIPRRSVRQQHCVGRNDETTQSSTHLKWERTGENVCDGDSISDAKKLCGGVVRVIFIRRFGTAEWFGGVVRALVVTVELEHLQA